MSVEIVPCRLGHLHAIARDLRIEDRAELGALGLEPRPALFHYWRETPGPLAALVNGEIGAAWGDAGSLLDPLGQAWLFATPLVETVPVTFFRFAREWLTRRLQTRTTLRSSVLESHEKALRLYRMLGFEIGPPMPQPPYGHPFCEIRIGRAAAGPFRYFDTKFAPTVGVSGRA